MEKFTALTVLAVPFSIIISVCYLVGYWWSFKVDIFSYLTASDIVVLSAIPWLGIGLTSFIGLSLAKASQDFDKFSKDSDDNDIVVIRKGIRIFDKAVFIILILVIFFGGPSKWLIIPVLFSLFLTALIVLSGVIELNQESSQKKTLLIFMVILLPFQAYGYGKVQALRIEQGSNYRFLINKIYGIYAPRLEDIRYLGKAGEDIFLFNASNSQVIIVKRDSVDPMVLQSSDEVKEENTQK